MQICLAARARFVYLPIPWMLVGVGGNQLGFVLGTLLQGGVEEPSLSVELGGYTSQHTRKLGPMGNN